MLLYSEGDNASQEADAQSLMELLTLAYPNHPWAVRVGTGFVYVRYLDPWLDETFRGPVGYKIPTAKLFSASEAKRQVILAGGELLERLNLKRGVGGEDEVTSMEDVPKKFYKDERVIETKVVQRGGRSRPARPQALKNG